MAVAKTSAFTIRVQNKSKQNTAIDVSVLNQEVANANAKVDKNYDTAVTFYGNKDLGFAVELQELKYDENKGNIQLKPSDEAMVLKGACVRKTKKQPGITNAVFIKIM